MDDSSKNSLQSNVNPHLEGFTVRTIDELLDHNYYRHRLEQNANELFWKRVFAWRASVSLALAIMGGALTWFGLELKDIGKTLFNEEVNAIRDGGEKQIAALKKLLTELEAERESVTKKARELDGKTAELDNKIRNLDDSLRRSGEESGALKKASEEAKAATEKALKLAEGADKMLQEGGRRADGLSRQMDEFTRDAELLRNVRRLNDEARSVRLFRMILLHSNDTQAFDFDVPLKDSRQTRPVSVTFKTPKMKNDDFAELSWEVREGGQAVSSTTATLFPGKEVAVDKQGDLNVRVEAIRKQPFARSFMILTVRARAPEEPKLAVPIPAKASSAQ